MTNVAPKFLRALGDTGGGGYLQILQEHGYADDPLAMIHDFHDGKFAMTRLLNNMEIDSALGWNTRSTEESVIDNVRSNPGVYEGEQAWLGRSEGIWTSYNHIRSVMRTLRPQEGQIFYDLGSGQGRVINYGAMVCDAMFKGIEMVPERVAAANEVKRRHSLSNAEFILGSVLDADFSEGDMFYMYSPFSTNTRDVVLQRLDQVAGDKPIQVIAYLGSQEVLRGKNLVFKSSPANMITIFTSNFNKYF